MNEITFEVKIRFSGKLNSDEEILEVQKHVMESLVYMSDTAGLTPDESVVYSVNVQVFEPLTQSMICKELL